MNAEVLITASTAPSATAIAESVIARIEATLPPGPDRGDLAYEVAVHLENYASDCPDLIEDEVSA